MDKKKVAYWVTTGIFCAALGTGGVFNLLKPPEMIEIFANLGYPTYMMTLLGILKILGVIAVLAPGFPLLKEWAYAGFVFDMIGAAFSHAAVGDPVGETVVPIVLMGVIFASWALRPDSRRLT